MNARGGNGGGRGGSGPVPDDETITLASGLHSCMNSVIPEESESSSNGEELIEFQYFNEDKLLRPPTSPVVVVDHKKLGAGAGAGAGGAVAPTPSSTASFLHEMATANTRQVLEDSIPRRPLKLPHYPERPSLADFDRWSSNSSVSSDPSITPIDAPKLPRRRQLSPSRLLPPVRNDEESKHPHADGDEHEVMSLIGDIVASYAAVAAEQQSSRQPLRLKPSKPCLKKTNAVKSISLADPRPSYPVVFDTVEIRDYARTVGDNPACTCGPPIALDWHVCATQSHSLDHYESSIKPVKRTKKQFYLPARLRVNILMEDWQIPEDDLKRARREVTYIQYCRERSVVTSRAANAAANASAAAPIIPASPEGTSVRRKGKVPANAMTVTSDASAVPLSPPPYRAPSQLQETPAPSDQTPVQVPHDEDPPAKPSSAPSAGAAMQASAASMRAPLQPVRKARSLSPPRVSPSHDAASQELPLPADAQLAAGEDGEEPEAAAPASTRDSEEEDEEGDGGDGETRKKTSTERPEITPESPKKRTVRKQLSCSNLSAAPALVALPLKLSPPPVAPSAPPSVNKPHTLELPSVNKSHTLDLPSVKCHTLDLVRASSEVFVPRRMELLEL